jgi:hypothetical protein
MKAASDTKQIEHDIRRWEAIKSYKTPFIEKLP